MCAKFLAPSKAVRQPAPDRDVLVVVSRRRLDAGFDRFVIETSPMLLRTAHRLTGNVHLAEDLLQAALWRVARNWARASDNPVAYARKALVNLAIDGRRARSRRVVEVPGSIPEVSTTDQPYERDEELLAALTELPPPATRGRRPALLGGPLDRGDGAFARMHNRDREEHGEQGARQLAKPPRATGSTTMSDLESALRERLATVSEPQLRPPPGIAARLRRRHERRRQAVPLCAGALVVGGAAVAVRAVPVGSQKRLSPTTRPPGTAATTPTPTPAPPRTHPVTLANLTFDVPADLRVERGVVRHDNTAAYGAPAFATDVALSAGRRGLGITVYEGRLGELQALLQLGEMERHLVIAGYPARAATTVSEVPPGIAPSMAAEIVRPFAKLLVRVGRQHTVLLTATGFSEDDLVAFAETALERYRAAGTASLDLSPGLTRHGP